MLEVSGLFTGYGRVPVLADVAIHAGDGEFVGILGHNGMGKSTLLKAVMGQLPARSGQIAFDGHDVTNWLPHQRARGGMSLVPQGRAIFSSLTVRQNLEYAVAASRSGGSEIVEETLTMFPRLKPLLGRPGGALSGGEQQLLSLARALCTRPKLVLLDEPTEGVQPSICDEIVQTLHELRNRWRFALVVVEQDLDFVAALSDRVYVIRKGQIAGEHSRHEVADTSFINRFLGLEEPVNA